jgi:hypothetical protein
MASKRYDELSHSLSPAEMCARSLVRVSPDFCVIALGLPVPRFAGYPLDPPLRSRFQVNLYFVFWCLMFCYCCVIVLGLPVPRFGGYTLVSALRLRF